MKIKRLNNGNILITDAADKIQRIFPPTTYIVKDPRKADTIWFSSTPANHDDQNSYKIPISEITVPSHSGVDDLMAQLSTDFLYDNISGFGAQKKLISRYLDLTGDGTGAKDANVDGTTPKIFSIKPAAGEIFRISQLVIMTADGAPFSASTYGALAALTNGVQVRVQNDSVTLNDLTDGMKIKSNARWSALAFNMALSDYGVGDDFLHVNWDFKEAGQVIRLIGDNNERLEVIVNDNLTALSEHTFAVQGYQE